MRKKPVDKIAVARSRGEFALSSFQFAHDDLMAAIALLHEAENDHAAHAQEHLDRASEARSLSDQHTKAATKIAEILGQ